LEAEPGRRIFESGLRMHHFRRGPFAPVGKGFFSTRSTSKGFSEAARILSEEISHSDGIGFGEVGTGRSPISCPFRSWSLASVSSRSLSILAGGPLPRRSFGGEIQCQTWVHRKVDEPAGSAYVRRLLRRRASPA